MSSSSSLSLIRFVTGIIEASIAPFFMVVGFYVWDHHWNGSPFALNMLKCNVAAFGFIVVVAMGILSENGRRRGGTMDGDGSLIDSTIADIHIVSIAMLMLSSFLGIVMGDFCWLEGMRILSARKIILVDCLKPFLAAYVGWTWFDEQLGASACLGLVLTCFGVLLVELEQTDVDESPTSSDTASTELNVVKSYKDSTERDSLLDQSRSSSTTPPTTATMQPQKSESMNSSYAEQRQNQATTATIVYGYIVAFLNVILHTAGATLTKMYGVDMNTWLICLIRFGFAGLVLATISISFYVVVDGGKSRKQSSDDDVRETATITPWYQLPRMPTAWWMYVLAGVGCCTFIMPALINDAIFKIPLALLLTLESIGPLYSLPVSWMVQKDVPTWKSCTGALLAVGGIAILSLKGMTTDGDASV